MSDFHERPGQSWRISTMKIVYLIKQDVEKTTHTILEENRKDHDVTVIDLREDRDYEAIVSQIASCDLVLTW